MVYIDYDKCVSCGQCLLECWNYNLRINPEGAYHGALSIKRRVVSQDWVSNYPTRP